MNNEDQIPAVAPLRVVGEIAGIPRRTVYNWQRRQLLPTVQLSAQRQAMTREQIQLLCDVLDRGGRDAVLAGALK